MRTEIININPELARQFLASNTLNRKVSQSLVKRYAKSMLRGEWDLTHQGIAIYESGDIADGQHRLLAIAEFGCTIQTMITYGLKQPAGRSIDDGRPRSAPDSIRIAGTSSWIGKSEVAIARQVRAGEQLTLTEIEEICQALRTSIEFATSNFTSRRKGVCTSVVMTAVALAHHNGCAAPRLAEFCATLLTGVMSGEDDIAAVRLREYLLTSGAAHGAGERKDTLLRSQRAIQAFMRRERLQKLVAPKALIYVAVF